MKIMKKDKLEKFIVENREGFNDLEAPPMLWQAIKNSMADTGNNTAPRADTDSISSNSRGKIFRIGSIAWKAAAAILIFASAWYLNDYMDQSRPGNRVKSVAAVPMDNPVLNELSDAEAFYTSQINSRQAELAQYAKEHPEIIADLKKEFQELDKSNLELRKDLAESNADEKVVEAIIQSYRIKLSILEQMLSEMHEGRTGKSATTNL
jgi:hypothetical protein